MCWNTTQWIFVILITVSGRQIKGHTHKKDTKHNSNLGADNKALSYVKWGSAAERSWHKASAWEKVNQKKFSQR